jgi:hypothetical protein
MADEVVKLTCTKSVLINGGKDPQGRPINYHQRCGASASECEIGGTLTKAKAVLCAKHRLQADRETFTSQNGYPLGKITKALKNERYKQPRLAGTGLIVD